MWRGVVKGDWGPLAGDAPRIDTKRQVESRITGNGTKRQVWDTREKKQQWAASTYAMLVQPPVMIRRARWSFHLHGSLDTLVISALVMMFAMTHGDTPWKLIRTASIRVPFSLFESHWQDIKHKRRMSCRKRRDASLLHPSRTLSSYTLLQV